MKKLFPVALCFFLLAAAANLAGQVWMGELARMSKPALLPLLALVTLLGLPEESRERTCLITAQLLGFLGDVLLMKDGLPWFGSGIAAFLTGHIFYIRYFGGRSWKGLGWKAWAIGIPVMAALVAGLVSAIGIQGALLVPMAVPFHLLRLPDCDAHLRRGELDLARACRHGHIHHGPGPACRRRRGPHP